MSKNAPKTVMQFFDENWYQNQYPDVSAATIEANVHYCNFGWSEGRWPCAFNAVALDKKLWGSNGVHEILSALKNLVSTSTPVEKGLSAWFLCRWYASNNELNKAHDFIEIMLENDLALEVLNHEGPYVLAFYCLLKLGYGKEAQKLLYNKLWPSSENKLLAESMLFKGEKKYIYLNDLYVKYGLTEFLPSSETSIDNISCFTSHEVPISFFSPLVSIIIPCFNASETIGTALKSLVNQSYRKIEIIVVDDASNDDTKEIVQQFISKDSRIRYKRLESNGGAYNARNVGTKQSKGKLITTHDADDWSHPQKIEKQVEALQLNKRTKASISHWVRCDKELNFERWRIEDGWIHRNVSSLMVRRSVIQKLGYWDSVSVNADTEFYYRILSFYGPNSIKEVLKNVPLALGRIDPSSLTNFAPTHIRTQFLGLRKLYMDAAHTWHKENKKLHVSFHGKRNFIAPPYMCRANADVKLKNLERYITEHSLFDEGWYLSKYLDIKAANISPLTHFIKHGIYEGREPNTLFSPSAYSYLYNISYYDSFVLWSSQLHLTEHILFKNGSLKRASGFKNVLMVAHLAGREVYGAEQSFLDSINMLSAENVNVYAILPSAENLHYVEQIREKCVGVFFLPVCWWRQDREPIQKTVDNIESLIEKYTIDMVYVNTITLWEPLIAAKNSNVHSCMHIREIPENDASLCSYLNASPDQIRQHVNAAAKSYVANSKATANYYGTKRNCIVVPNSVDFEQYHVAKRSSKQRLTAILISSNIQKKGIEDLFTIAKKCDAESLSITFKIYGPQTELLAGLINAYHLKNVFYEGYTTNVPLALEEADILFNLSHFNESFGRTVIEGMAAGCVPIVYERGALTELVDEDCGYLIPFQDVDLIVVKIKHLLNNNNVLLKLSENAVSKASKCYSYEAVARTFTKLFC